MALNDTSSATTVTGFFEDRSDAERAINALKDAGFTSTHIGVAHKDGNDSNDDGESMWGKVKDFFGAGDPVEPYADEKSQGDLASRTVTSSGYDDDAYTDNFSGTMRGMSVDEDRSKYMTHRFGSSDKGAVVTVTAAGREAQAESILKQYGADLGENAKDYNYGSAGTAGNADTSNLTGTQNIQLLGEALRVHKDRVSRGEVTIRKEVVTEMQTIQVPVTREELVIERRAVADGTSVDGTIGEGREIRIPLSEERASAEKSTFVREEVSVGKRTVEDVKELSDNVKHEELEIDDNTTTPRNR